MPEIKQNFTRGKMNKDLDERLIPKGEYREAQNIHISESEGSDVGAIENILSNLNVTTAITSPSNANTEEYEVIGYCKDLAKKRIIYFVTNFRGLAFTDNIRSIDRQLAAGTPQYGDLRHHSYIVLYDVEEQAQYTLVSGAWLNLSKNHLITGVQIVDDLLFWTDNFNQPRKINIQTALDNYASGSDQYYDCEETISVAKYAPYKPIMLHDDAGTGGLPTIEATIESDYIKEKFVRFSYRYKYDDGEYSLIAPFTQSVFEPLNSGIITNSASDNEKNSTANEPTVLTGKKEVYKKGIVDIMQNRINKVELRIPLPNKDEFVTTSPGSTYSNPYHIDEIDILLKESDGISFKLVKNVKVSEITSSDIEVYTVQNRDDTNKYYRQVYKYTYKSSEPYQVLPEGQVNRVYDQVPVLAKALEVVGNRVVFGNYVENYPYPTDISGRKGINYTIGSATKGTVDQQAAISPAAEPYLYGLKQWMHKAYKYHTVKQRRTYQVGIVFSDIFGRQSPVILSSNIQDSNPDTFTMPIVASSFGDNTNGVWNTTHDSYGKSLVISFEDNDLTGDSKFVANMKALSSVYNPHGWYSYRIVVKQQEQEYYNVYAPHTFDGWDNIKEEPNDSLTGGRSWLFLHGDNVNKVPRSLNDTDLNRDGTMGSNVRLYPKVIFDADGESKMNDSYHELTEVISLGTAYEQNLYISGDDNKSGTGGFSVLNFVYGKNKNPLVAELQNMEAYTGSTSNNEAKVYYLYSAVNNSTTMVLGSDQVGGTKPTDFVDDDFNQWSVNMSNIPHNEELLVLDTIGTASNKHEIVVAANQDFDDVGDKIILSNYYEGLSVFETEPFKSKLDVYYETSTSGLVADLIQEIVADPDDTPTELTIKQDTYDFGSGQPPVATTPATNPDGSARYGAIAFLYENTTSGTYIGDIDATESTNAVTKDLSFELNKAIRLGDNTEKTNNFTIELDSGTPKLKTVGTFAFRGNTFDNYDIQVKVTDNDTGGIAYMSVTVFVKNSAPTITIPTGPQEIRVDAGSNAIVINSNNDVTNGSLLTSGDVNKFTGLTVTHTFEEDTSSDDLFVLSTPEPGKYELRTSTEFTPSAAANFFNKNNDDRTVTITVTDASGLEANESVRIDEDETVTVLGKIWQALGTTEDDVIDSIEDQYKLFPVYVSQGTGSDAPEDEAKNCVKIFEDNVIFTNSSLDSTLSAGTYISVFDVDESLISGDNFTARIIEVNSSGIVTSSAPYTEYRLNLASNVL